MTSDDFRLWRKRWFKSRDAAAAALGRSVSTIRLYEDGRRRDTGEAVEIPETVALACAAITAAREGTAATWMPWPSAPSDGTSIIVRMRSSRDGGVIRVIAHKRGDGWIIDFTGGDLLADPGFVPDGWAPCPAL